MSESAAARRLELLVRSGALYRDVDIAPELLGYPAGATLYLEVTPSRVPAVGTLLAAHQQTAFVAATLGRLNGVEHVEVSTVSRTVKHARSVTDENRLTTSAGRG
jgi:hypothetical protein